ncbi:MAG: hypothetical protein H7A55_22735 [Verrucomicrobiaceae bacterium]|nr:hypothetical protein [Verrucomicrobiaceae bacterium]
MKIPDDLQIPNTPFPTAAKELAAVAHPDEAGDTSVAQLKTKFAEIQKALIEMTNHAWRIGQSVNDPETGEPKEELARQDIRRVAKAADALGESITNVGIRVLDRCGEDFDPGLPDQVITEEPREGISRDRIIRTIRPTIMWGLTMVQQGQIDIAVPAKQSSDGAI